MTEKKRKSLNFKVILLLFGMIPLVTSVTIVSIISFFSLQSSLEKETLYKLEASATALAEHYNNYNWEDEIDHAYVDSLVSQNIELTLFKEDVRYATSIKDNKGSRIEGTKADPEIYKQVHVNNQVYTSKDVKINDKYYYVCYVPLADGGGMAFAGASMESVNGKLGDLASALTIGILICIVFFVILIIIIACIVQKPLRLIAVSANELAEGYVYKDIQIHSIATETISIINSLKKVQTNLSSTVSAIQNNTDTLNSSIIAVDDKTKNVASSAEEMSSTIHEVANANQNLANNVEGIGEVTSNIDTEITSMASIAEDLHDNSKHIADANKEAVNALNDMAEGNKNSISATKDIIKHVQETSDTIQGITSVLSMIKSVADQTKLLSLNASIEAARAGDAGRGFAVVADEIQKLSLQSAEGVNKIKELSDEMIVQAEQSLTSSKIIEDAMEKEVSAINRVEQTFGVLQTSIDKSLSSINTLRESTEHVSKLKDTIVGNIHELGALSEENAASSEEISASIESVASAMSDVADMCQDISKVAANLKEVVSVFK